MEWIKEVEEELEEIEGMDAEVEILPECDIPEGVVEEPTCEDDIPEGVVEEPTCEDDIPEGVVEEPTCEDD